MTAEFHSSPSVPGLLVFVHAGSPSHRRGLKNINVKEVKSECDKRPGRSKYIGEGGETRSILG